MNFSSMYNGNTENVNALFDRLPVALGAFDESVRLIDCNEKWWHLFGFDEKEKVLSSFEALLQTQQPCGSLAYDVLYHNIEKVLSEKSAKFELFLVKLNNEPMCLDISISYETAGFLIACAAEVRHYKNPLSTDMKKVYVHDDLSHIVLDAIPIAATIFDRNLNALDCNQTSAKMFGNLSKEEYLKDLNPTLLPAQPNGRNSVEVLKEHLSIAFENGYSYLNEFMFRKLDGTLMIVELTYMRIRYKGDFAVISYRRDITEETATKEREQEALLRQHLLYDANPIAASLWDENLNVIDCNEAMVRLLELSGKQDYIERFFDFAPEFQIDGTNSKEKFAELFKAAKDEGTTRLTWLHQTTSKQIIPSDVTVVKIALKGRYMFAAYLQDLRPLMEASEKIREAEERAKLMLDAAPLAISLRGKDLHTIDCNQESLKMLGVADRDEYMSRLWMPACQPDGRNSKELMYSLIAKSFNEGFSETEVLAKRADGTIFPVHITWVRVKYRDDYVVVEYTRDLTETRTAMEREREANEMTQMFMENLPISIKLWDENLNLVYCNQKTVELFGTSSGSEYIGYSFMFSPKYQPCGTPSAKKVKTVLEQALREGMAQFEWMHLTKAGEPLPVEVTLIRVLRNGKNMIVGYNHDMRAIKKAIEEAKRSELAEEENRSKTRFLARMSHEIRTPLNVIKGVSEIELRKETLSSDTEEAFLRIHNSSDLLLTLINDILDLSKVEAGKMEIVPNKYEVTSLIVDTVQLNLMYIGNKAIKFKLNVDELMPTHLIGDDIRIKQILNNLLSNAFKYTDEGMVSLSFGLSRSVPEDNSREAVSADNIVLLIRIEDTGQGMTPEQIETMFDVFTRHNLESNRGVEGSGLGMNIVYQLIKMMHGDISVKSEPGTGTAFTVRLPQKLSSPIVIGKETAENLQNLEITQRSLKKMYQEPCKPMPHGKVLVVDDVESNLFVAKGLLAPYKLTIDTAESGYEAISKIKTGEVYDIIFMDHMMPGMDGVEAAHIIRDIGYHYPIIALTANTVKGQEEQFLKDGFSGFIAKPIDANLLNSCLLRFIRDKPAKTNERNDTAVDDFEVNTDIPPFPLELLKAVLRDAEKSMNRMEAIMKEGLFDEHSIKMYAVHAHAIKSALTNISQAELSGLAYKLEHAPIAQTWKLLRQKHPSF